MKEEEQVERLTTRPQAALIKCCYCKKELDCHSEIECDAVDKAFELLSAYENTGLTPAEIDRLVQAMELVNAIIKKV